MRCGELSKDELCLRAGAGGARPRRRGRRSAGVRAWGAGRRYQRQRGVADDPGQRPVPARARAARASTATCWSNGKRRLALARRGRGRAPAGRARRACASTTPVRAGRRPAGAGGGRSPRSRVELLEPDELEALRGARAQASSSSAARTADGAVPSMSSTGCTPGGAGAAAVDAQRVDPAGRLAEAAAEGARRAAQRRSAPDTPYWRLARRRDRRRGALHASGRPGTVRARSGAWPSGSPARRCRRGGLRGAAAARRGESTRRPPILRRSGCSSTLAAQAGDDRGTRRGCAGVARDLFWALDRADDADDVLRAAEQLVGDDALRHELTAQRVRLTAAQGRPGAALAAARAAPEATPRSTTRPGSRSRSARSRRCS